MPRRGKKLMGAFKCETKTSETDILGGTSEGEGELEVSCFSIGGGKFSVSLLLVGQHLESGRISRRDTVRLRDFLDTLLQHRCQGSAEPPGTPCEYSGWKMSSDGKSWV